MNSVSIVSRDMEEPAWLPKAEAFAQKVLAFLELDNWDLSLLFCGDEFIASLNEEYRRKAGPTDVLSFEQGDWYEDGNKRRFLAGDVVLCLDAMLRNADDFKVTPDEELKRLIVHGILHLSGMDHEGTEPEEPMLIRQEAMLKALAEERIL
ncbi:MAG TPA: rRNA maturation RNase YbeY [Spirochaetaceae bacterium]|nr:rRNA maturation RNase YbeY [Spirochaetaceae bacterium]